MSITDLRTELAARKGQWSALAVVAGCNRKTIERIVHQPDYMPNMRTFDDLVQALNASPAKEQAA